VRQTRHPGEYLNLTRHGPAKLQQKTKVQTFVQVGLRAGKLTFRCRALKLSPPKTRHRRRNVASGPAFDYAASLMKVDSIRCLSVLLLVSSLLAGCASNSSSTAAANQTTQKKGHWITLAPETGSMIPRRVWIDDSGQADGATSMNNVRTGSTADMEKIQNIPPRISRPPGS